jgi:hypothetical protein
MGSRGTAETRGVKGHVTLTSASGIFKGGVELCAKGGNGALQLSYKHKAACPSASCKARHAWGVKLSTRIKSGEVVTLRCGAEVSGWRVADDEDD